MSPRRLRIDPDSIEKPTARVEVRGAAHEQVVLDRFDGHVGKSRRVQDAGEAVAVGECPRPGGIGRLRRRRGHMLQGSRHRDAHPGIATALLPAHEREPSVLAQAAPDVAERGDRVVEEHDPEA